MLSQEPPSNTTTEVDGWVSVEGSSAVATDSNGHQAAGGSAAVGAGFARGAMDAEVEATVEREAQEAKDAALAAALAGGGHVEGAVGGSAQAPWHGMGQMELADAELAAALQRQMQEDFDLDVRHREHLENRRLVSQPHSRLAL